MVINKNKRIGIWGFGIVGKAAAEYFSNQGHQISVMDKRIPTIQEAEYSKTKNIAWYSEDKQETFFNSCDIIIPSPGINIDPTRYATYKDKWVHELDFFYALCNKPIIAITGSIGKTSITHILENIFKKLAIPAAVGGNIGTATFDLIKEQDNVQYTVLEVSSFQLQHCKQFAPMLAVWTNFYPNHLDHHATQDEYLLAKYNILKYQAQNNISLIPFVLRNQLPAPGNNTMRSYFTTACPNVNELNSLADNEQIYCIINNSIIRYKHGSQTLIASLTEELLHFSFIDNILVLAAICDLLHINPAVLQTIATTTQLPAHRVEKITTMNNVDFYNDSKATTTASTLAAVKKLYHRPLHLFLGGLSKGVDRTSFVAQLKDQVKYIYCFGKEAYMLHDMCNTYNIPSTPFTTLTQAVEACIKKIEPHDCVLLSPAGSSYDLYDNFEQRGNHFKELILNFIQKKQ